MITEISGNILDSKEQYICHQCNCITKTAAGLAKAIFDKWPESNTYIKDKCTICFINDLKKLRYIESIRIFGSLSIHPINDTQSVVNFYSQYKPGKPDSSNSNNRKTRLERFQQCMTILFHLNPKSIALPYNIGCGLAGGIWEDYYTIIKSFDSEDVNIFIYKL